MGAAGADRAGLRLVGAGAVRAAGAAEPDVGDAGRAGDRDLDGVLGAADRPLSRGARGRARAARRAAAHLRVDRRGGGRLGRDRDRRLRGARALRRADAVRLRARDGRRPVGLAARRARGAAGGADAGRAARRARRPPRRRRWWRSPRSPHERARAASAARGDVALHLDRRRAGGAGAGLHHAQHARHREARLARRAERAEAAAVRGPDRDVEAQGRRAGRPEQGVQGARLGRPQLLPARRARPGRAGVLRHPLEALRAAGRRDGARAPALPGRRLRGGVGARRPRRRARPGAQARLGDAGRLRPRRRGDQRLRGGDLPDDHVRAPRRGGGGHVVQAARARRRSRARWRRCGDLHRARDRGRVPGPPPARAHARGALRSQLAGAPRAVARALRPLPRRAGDRAAAPADPARLPRLLPPHRARPRRAPHAGRGAGARAAEVRRLPLALGARRRAHDRGDGDRRAGVGARRRPAGRGGRAARRGARRAARRRRVRPRPARPGGWCWPTTPGRSGCCSARSLPAAASAGGPRGSRCWRCRWRACRTSTSRRRCGPCRAIGGEEG